jgi:uncharacterized membrane protein (UPF0136 family)
VVQVGAWVLVIYGAFMIVGGILGYVLPKKPSRISLISGVATGLLSLGAAWVASHDSALAGLAMGLVIALGIGVMMGLRALETRKFMPGGMIAALSGVVATILALALALGDT